MVDEFRQIRDNLLKSLLSSTKDEDDDEEREESSSGIDSMSAKALLNVILTRAGKSKDDVIQILSREIGQAIAAMLKEPLKQLATHQKLQITFEFVPKEPPRIAKALESPEEAPAKASRTKRSSRVRKADIGRK